MATTTAINRWQDFKFGMFIHYGLYSIPGEGEWAMFNKPIDKDEYAKLTTRFSAEHFDAQGLADLAKSAGMKYMVLTARHHDGFCLFDSKNSIGDYTVMSTPAKRDLIADYTTACRAAGLAAGIYYSPMDWRCEGFFFPQMYHRSAMAMRAQCHAQVRELMSNYGKIDVLWYDGGEDFWLAHGKHLNSGTLQPEDWQTNPLIPNFWGEDELDDMVRGLQPEIVVNNRIGMCRRGDYKTPECVVGDFNITDPWETCDTLTGSWGWTPNRTPRTAENIIHLLTDVITGGGNLLLNVSPMGDGSLEPLHAQRLREAGEWLATYGEAVYHTRGGPVKNNIDVGGAVCRENKVYFHIKNKDCGSFRLPLAQGAGVVGVRGLTGETCTYAVSDGILTVQLPSEGRNAIETIVEVSLTGSVAEIYAGFDTNYNAF